uniref:Uncharacterized protein n=1 Tax=Ditylenchus dipsaci TaxID=166011 RepID=A0A915DHI7_9BILA
MVKLDLRFPISKPFGLLKTAQLIGLSVSFGVDTYSPEFSEDVRYALIVMCAFSYLGHLFEMQHELNTTANH